MKAVGYVRVSTLEQANEGVSLAAQTDRLHAYAKAYPELKIIEVIEDAGVSGKTLAREGLRRALRLIDSGKAEGLLIAKLDRLTRSVADMAKLASTYFSEKAGKHLVSVSDHIDTKTAAGRLVLNVLVSVSQWEREAIGERTSAALQHKKSKGEVYGQVPLGYARRGKMLVPIAEELATVAEAMCLRKEGRSFAAIAAQFTAENRKTKRGGRWHPVTILSLLAAQGSKPQLLEQDLGE